MKAVSSVLCGLVIQCSDESVASVATCVLGALVFQCSGESVATSVLGALVIQCSGESYEREATCVLGGALMIQVCCHYLPLRVGA